MYRSISGEETHISTVAVLMAVVFGLRHRETIFHKHLFSSVLGAIRIRYCTKRDDRQLYWVA